MIIALALVLLIFSVLVAVIFWIRGPGRKIEQNYEGEDEGWPL